MIDRTIGRGTNPPGLTSAGPLAPGNGSVPMELVDLIKWLPQGGAAGREESGTARAGNGRVLGAAAPANGHRAASTPILAPRLAVRGVAAASAALERPPPRVLILDAPRPDSAVLLLAGILTAALALFLGWQMGSRRQRRR